MIQTYIILKIKGHYKLHGDCKPGTNSFVRSKEFKMTKFGIVALWVFRSVLCKRNRPSYFPEDNFSNLVSVFVNKYILYTYGKNPMKKL